MSTIDGGNLRLIGKAYPTAPDTLACFPSEEDPFVMANAPHVLAFGNQPEYEARVVKDTTVLLVPAFETSKTLVLYNLATKNVSTIKFSISE